MRRLAQLTEEEEKNLLKDEPEVVDIIVKSIQSLRAEEQTLRGETPEEAPEARLRQEVLQTKIVSGREVEENFVEWKEAIVKEMDSLMLEKKALTRLSPERGQEAGEFAQEGASAAGKGGSDAGVRFCGMELWLEKDGAYRRTRSRTSWSGTASRESRRFRCPRIWLSRR